jgi:hypothetical protein
MVLLALRICDETGSNVHELREAGITNTAGSVKNIVLALFANAPRGRFSNDKFRFDEDLGDVFFGVLNLTE